MLKFDRLLWVITRRSVYPRRAAAIGGKAVTQRHRYEWQLSARTGRLNGHPQFVRLRRSGEADFGIQAQKGPTALWMFVGAFASADA